MNATATPAKPPFAESAETVRHRVNLALRDHTIPEHMHGGVLRYLLDGIVPCQFLLGLLTNDLAAAQAHADHQNAEAWDRWLAFLREAMPTNTWGHPRVVADWITRKGLNGRAGDATPKMGTPVLPKDPPVLSNRPKPSVLLALSAEIDKRVQDATRHLGEIIARIPDGITAEQIRYAMNDLAVAKTSTEAICLECRKAVR